MDIIQAIKAIRKAEGWTQEQMAEAYGVRKQSVWRWEHGVHVPTGPAQKLIMRHYDEINNG